MNIILNSLSKLSNLLFNMNYISLLSYYDLDYKHNLNHKIRLSYSFYQKFYHDFSINYFSFNYNSEQLHLFNQESSNSLWYINNNYMV